MQWPLVTVLIPARNEAGDLAACLAAVVAQDYAENGIEVVVVDGGSTDDTVEVAYRVLERERDLTFTVIRGPGPTPENLNAGLAAASGDIICRVDARSIIPPDYVRTCAELLIERPELRVVGGAQVAIEAGTSTLDRGITRALNNRWAMGGSRYRRGASSGAADTVYLGAFRTEQLRQAGGWDPRLATNQDFELNRRMGADGVVWFESSLLVGYVPRRSLGDLWRQYRRFGEWKVRYWDMTGDRPRPRQLVMIVVPMLAAVGGIVAMKRAPAPTVILAGLGAGAVDHFGRPNSSSVSLPTRLASIAAMVVVAGGWWSGVVAGMARRHRSASET